MDKKAKFKKVNLPKPSAEKAVDNVAQLIQNQVSEQVEAHIQEILKELGYNVPDSPSEKDLHILKQKLDEDGLAIEVSHDTVMGEDGKATLKVHLNLVQHVRTISFSPKEGGKE